MTSGFIGISCTIGEGPVVTIRESRGALVPIARVSPRLDGCAHNAMRRNPTELSIIPLSVLCWSQSRISLI